jgi:hypothetical protein
MDNGGCEGCKVQIEQQNAEFNSMVQKAKIYAKENAEAVAVYYDGGWRFIRASIAIEGNYQIKTIVSQYSA